MKTRKFKIPLAFAIETRFSLHPIFFILLLFASALLIPEAHSDSQSVYDIASRSVFKITALNAFNQEIRHGFGVSIGKSKCEETEIYFSDVRGEFKQTNQEGSDIFTTYDNVFHASTIFLESIDGKKTEAAIVYLDSIRNISIIRSKNKVNCTYPKTAKDIKPGKKLYVYSFANSKSETFWETFIDEMVTDFIYDLITVSKKDKTIKSGSSVFDEEGNLVGLCFGKSIKSRPENALILFTPEISKEVLLYHSYNIDHPGNLLSDDWSVGIHYIPKLHGVREIFEEAHSNYNWIMWKDFSNCIGKLEILKVGDLTKEYRGFRTGSSRNQIYRDAIDCIYNDRTAFFPYDIDGRLNEIYKKGYSGKSLSEIQALREEYGYTLKLTKILIENLYSISDDSSFKNFVDFMDEFFIKLPEYSESIQYRTQQEILDMKSTIEELPTWDNEQSKMKKEYINSIVERFNALGWIKRPNFKSRSIHNNR